MTNKSPARQKFIVRLAAAQKEADALKKAAQAAKAELKRAKKKFKQEKKLAKAAKKTVKLLREELRAATVVKKRVARKRPARPAAPKVEPVVTEPEIPRELVEVPAPPPAESPAT